MDIMENISIYSPYSSTHKANQRAQYVTVCKRAPLEQ